MRKHERAKQVADAGEITLYTRKHCHPDIRYGCVAGSRWSRRGRDAKQAILSEHVLRQFIRRFGQFSGAAQVALKPSVQREGANDDVRHTIIAVKHGQGSSECRSVPNLNACEQLCLVPVWRNHSRQRQQHVSIDGEHVGGYIHVSLIPHDRIQQVDEFELVGFSRPQFLGDLNDGSQRSCVWDEAYAVNIRG